MRSGRKFPAEGRGTGYGRSPAWSQRWAAGLAAAACCLALLAALNANLSGWVQSAPQRRMSSFNLSTPSPAARSEPRSRPREMERPPVAQAETKVLPAEEPGKARRPSSPSSPLPVPTAIPPVPLLPSEAKPAPAQSEVVPVQAPDEKAKVLASYQRRLWARIAARRPAGLHMAGIAFVRFVIGREGELISAELARSSGNAALDRLALRTVRNSSPFPAPPMGLESDPLVFTIPFSFH